jgi:hypothetical protein
VPLYARLYWRAFYPPSLNKLGFPRNDAEVLFRRDITPEKLADNLGEALHAKTGFRWVHEFEILPGAGSREDP